MASKLRAGTLLFTPRTSTMLDFRTQPLRGAVCCACHWKRERGDPSRFHSSNRVGHQRRFPSAPAASPQSFSQFRDAHLLVRVQGRDQPPLSPRRSIASRLPLANLLFSSVRIDRELRRPVEVFEFPVITVDR